MGWLGRSESTSTARCDNLDFIGGTEAWREVPGPLWMTTKKGQRQEPKQVPFGDDNKKDKDNCNG
jgi:hypothetical protein